MKNTNIIKVCKKCSGRGGWMIHGYGSVPDWIICNKCHGAGWACPVCQSTNLESDLECGYCDTPRPELEKEKNK